MPKRGSRGHQNASTALNRQMLENTPALCKSQVYNEVYDRIKKDGRLNRFIAVVQYCSMSGLSVEDSVDAIIKAFPSYIDKNDFNVACFEDMLKNYQDISIAWGYGPLGDEITQIMIKNKATELAMKTQNMEDIQVYNSMYGKNETVGQNDKTVFNFSLTKKNK